MSEPTEFDQPYQPWLPLQYPEPPQPMRPKRNKGRVLVAAGVVGALSAAGIAAGMELGSHSSIISGTGLRAQTLPATSNPGSSGSGASGSAGSGSNGSGSTDPFGGSGDPFGGSGSNPFGGSGSNPFGGSSSGGSGTTATTAQQVGVVDVNTVLKYQGAQAAGTGMILNSDGEVLTNNHVVDGATSISVTVVSTGKTYTAT